MLLLQFAGIDQFPGPIFFRKTNLNAYRWFCFVIPVICCVSTDYFLFAGSTQAILAYFKISTILYFLTLHIHHPYVNREYYIFCLMIYIHGSDTRLIPSRGFSSLPQLGYIHFHRPQFSPSNESCLFTTIGTIPTPHNPPMQPPPVSTPS